MRRIIRGKVFVINNERFFHLTHRDGTDKDQYALDRLFTQLGFKVIIKRNATAKVSLLFDMADHFNFN